MHHKRNGPKSTRAGCLLCKPHKRQGFKRDERSRHSARRAMAITSEKVSEAGQAEGRTPGARALRPSIA